MFKILESEMEKEDEDEDTDYYPMTVDSQPGKTG